MTIKHSDEKRAPLSRDRVLEAAIDLADRDGIDGLSMRKLGHALGIEAMSLYTHVRGKEDLLDGMVEQIVGGIEASRPGQDWKPALRETAMNARAVLLRHSWAPQVIEARVEPGMATIRHFDAVLGILRDGGFSLDLAHHAMHVLGSRVLGFNQDLYDDSTEMSADAAVSFSSRIAEAFPYVAEMALAASHDGGLGGCDDDVEFAFGLDLILDGLESMRLRDA